MLDAGQFVNCIWMGALLIFLGVTPGFLDKYAESISRFSAIRLFRFPLPPTHRISIPQPRWLAVLGGAIIVLTLFAQFAK